MSSNDLEFTSDWLTLREPADRRARASALVASLCRHLVAKAEAPSILDIGCGTGSTYRSLSGALPRQTRWTLLDRDSQLLAVAKKRIGQDGPVLFVQQDLLDLEALPVQDKTMVTASALFDLCSAEFCNRFVDRLTPQRTGLYAALNYNGVIEWSFTHPLDAKAVAGFNHHQRGDKGLGKALGPDATEHLRIALEFAHYRVSIAPSAWILTPEHKALHHAFLLGMIPPLREIGAMDAEEISHWLDFRLSQIGRDGSLCHVGHTDLLAIRRG